MLFQGARRSDAMRWCGSKAKKSHMCEIKLIYRSIFKWLLVVVSSNIRTRSHCRPKTETDWTNFPSPTTMFVYIANNWLWLTLSGKQRKVPQQLLPCSSIVIDCLRSLLSLPVWDVDRPLGSQWFRWGSSANKSLTICYLCRSQSIYRMVFKLCSN